jgi:hypothetical protein
MRFLVKIARITDFEKVGNRSSDLPAVLLAIAGNRPLQTPMSTGEFLG